MSYIGKKPTSSFASATSQTFTGNNSTTAFTLNRRVSAPEDLEVFVSNIQQQPTTSYTIGSTGLALNFDSAPPSGEFYVVYRNEAGTNAIDLGAARLAENNTFTEAQTFNNDVTFDGATAGRDIVFDRSDNALEFADNAKATFGSSDDLQIYHDGNHSYISDQGQGGITILNDSWMYIRSANASEIKAIFKTNSSVDLYYNNDKKFETTDTGVKFTGNAVIGADAADFTFATNSIHLGASADLKIGHTNNNNVILSDNGMPFSVYTDVFRVNSADNSENLFGADKNSSFFCKFDNNTKFQTTTNGAVVGGVTPETQHSSMKTVQVGARGFLTPFDSGAVYLTSNIFYNTSSQWEYATAGGGNVLSLNNGSLYYYHVQNGSNGGTASLVERFVIANNNNNNDNYIYYKSNRNSVAHYFQNEHGTYPYGCYIEFPNASPDNTSQYFLTCHDSTIARLRIYSDGDVVNHDNSYGSTSDERLKQDIVDASSQWDDIKNIKIRNFKKKNDVEKYGDKAWSQIGVIAQELETVSPKLIRETEPDENDVATNPEFGTVVDDTDKPIEYKETDTIPDGKKVGDIKGYEKKVEVKSNVKAVMYSVLYMKAVKALQEAMTRIETLEAKVAELESK